MEKKEEKIVKVLLLAPTPPPFGGIAGWTERMLHSELKNRWRVEVVDEKLIGKRGLFGDEDKRNYRQEVRRCFRIWKELSRKLKDPDIAVVHSCIPSYTFSMLREYVCACITKGRKKPFIIHFRSTVPNTKGGRLWRYLLVRLCQKSDGIIVLNRQSADYLKTLTRTVIELIPNFVNEEEIAKEKEIRQDVTKIVYVGGVIEEKGCCEIIEAAKAFPHISFYLVGAIDHRITEKASNTKNVIFTGTMDKAGVKQILREADVFLFLSWFPGEGFSNALAEAMAMGLPCIVTDWAANKDMVENKGGFVVPIRCPREVEKAIHGIMPPEIRERQSQFNRTKIRSAYRESIILEQYVDCYERCMK